MSRRSDTILSLAAPKDNLTYGQMIFVGVFLLFLVAHGCATQERRLMDRWETNGAMFSIRVTEYQEKHFPLSKFYFVFEAKAKGSSEWHEIMSTRTDEDIPIPREQVRFISDRAGYVFMTDKYAITTNSGDSWSIWKADDGITSLKYPGEFFIREVLVNPDGSGALVLASSSANRPAVQFRTNDFGYSWTAK